jgi:hypothetical protein
MGICLSAGPVDVGIVDRVGLAPFVEVFVFGVFDVDLEVVALVAWVNVLVWVDVLGWSVEVMDCAVVAGEAEGNSPGDL